MGERGTEKDYNFFWIYIFCKVNGFKILLIQNRHRILDMEVEAY